MTPRQRWALAIANGAALLLLLNVTIVLVALPDIGRAIGADLADLQWVVSAYALSLAALLLTAGVLADDSGRRRLVAIGFGLFAATSLVAGLAADPLFLIVARGAQGVAGAILLSTSLALIAHEFHGRERARALGVYGATVGFGTAVGPLLGGVLTDALSWRWIFVVSVPFALVALFFALTRLEESRREEHQGIDWPGLLTLTPALVLLVVGLTRGNEQGWGAPSTIVEFAAAVILLAAFLLVEARGRTPMMDVSLFRSKAFNAANVAVFAVSASVLALLAYVVLYLQQVTGQGPLAAGASLLPYAALSLASAPIAGRLVARFGSRALIGSGLLVAAAGLLAMRAAGADTSWAVLVPGLMLAGLSQGMLNPPIANAALNAVPPQRAGMASGMNNTFRQLGVATGIAGLGAVFAAGVESRARDGLSAAASFAGAFDTVLVVAAAIAAAGALAAILLLPAHRRSDAPSAPATTAMPETVR